MKPTPMTGLKPWSARVRNRSARWSSFSEELAGVAEMQEASSSSIAFFMPTVAESLNDWSPTPPTSYARPTLGPLPEESLQTSVIWPDEPVLLSLSPPQPTSVSDATAAMAANLLRLRKTPPQGWIQGGPRTGPQLGSP